MVEYTSFAKGRGKIHKHHRFLVIATSDGYDFANSDYINTSTENFTFYLCWGRVNSRPIYFFSADLDHMSSSNIEGHYGVAWFKKTTNDRIYHVSDNTEQPDIYIELINNALGDLFLGATYQLGSHSPLYFLKHSTPTNNRYQRLMENILKIKEYILPFSIEYYGSTPLAATAKYLVLTDYVTSGNLSSITASGTGKYQGYITNSDGSIFEHVLIHFIDSESNKVVLERGRGISEARAWTGVHYFYIFSRASVENYDDIQSISGLENGIKIRLMVEPKHAMFKSFYNIDMAYHTQEFSRKIAYYSNETGNLTNGYPDHVKSYLILTDDKPDTLTTDTLLGGKLTLKGTVDRYSDQYFTTAHEANQGVLYRYCGENESCGPCMTGQSTCFVKADGYQEVADGNDPLSSQVDHINWNEDNILWNKNFPNYLSYISYALLIIFMLTYVIWYAVFGSELSTVSNIDSFHDWPNEYRTTLKTAIGTGVLIAVVFLGVFGLMIVSAYQTDGNSIFPFVKFERSVYNPPPGYIFENSPTESPPS